MSPTPHPNILIVDNSVGVGCLTVSDIRFGGLVVIWFAVRRLYGSTLYGARFDVLRFERFGGSLRSRSIVSISISRSLVSSQHIHTPLAMMVMEIKNISR